MTVQNLDITSANAEGLLIVEEIYPAGIQLQMFGTDQAITQENITVSETRKGVDGKLVGGYTPVIYPVSIALEASSPSTQSLSNVWQAMATNKRVYACHLTCTVPSIGAVFYWRVGIMKSGSLFPNLQKVLAPTQWTFDFQDFERAKI